MSASAMGPARRRKESELKQGKNAAPAGRGRRSGRRSGGSRPAAPATASHVIQGRRHRDQDGAGRQGAVLRRPRDGRGRRRLKIKNNTNPRQVGPHTFSLVREETSRQSKERSRTAPASSRGSAARSSSGTRSTCRPARSARTRSRSASRAGTARATCKRKGDSWVSERKGQSFKRKVTATPRARRSTYFCAVHPEMQGEIKVDGVATGPVPERTGEQGARFGRRALLAAGVAGALALALPVRLRPGGLDRPGAARAEAGGRGGFRRALRIPPVLTGARSRSRCARRRSRCCPARKTKMWTYGGSFPGPTIRRPAGEQTQVTFVHRPAAQGRRADRPPARRPQPIQRGRPARRADGEPAARALLRHLARPARRRVRQRPADRARRPAHLHLRPDRGRRARARRVSVVSRPSPRAHRAERLARARRDVDHRRRLRRLAAAAARRARHPADAQPIAPSTSATSSPTRSAPAPTRPTTASPGALRARQRRPPAPITASAPPATGSGSSTPPTSAPTTSKLSSGAPMTQIATESGLMPRPVERRSRCWSGPASGSS